jgi:transposase-like protein
LATTCRYLSNIVEQDHRAIKRRCTSMLVFKSFDAFLACRQENGGVHD